MSLKPDSLEATQLAARQRYVDDVVGWLGRVHIRYRGNGYVLGQNPNILVGYQAATGVSSLATGSGPRQNCVDSHAAMAAPPLTKQLTARQRHIEEVVATPTFVPRR